MSYEISIVFEGLVVFVPRRNPSGGDPRALHVLLPNTQGGSGHHHVPHQAKIRKSPSGPQSALPLDLNLVGSGLDEGAGPTIPSLVPISVNTGARVSRALLTGPLTAGDKLQARITLPLPKKAEILAADELVPVEYFDDASKSWKPVPYPVAGRIRLTWDANGTVNVPTLGPVTGTTELSIAHLPTTPSPLPGTVIKAGAALEHLPMNDRIFGRPIPDYRTTKDFKVPPAAAHGEKSIFGIIPVECTAASGCAEGDPTCGEG
jgi:hypothetical protein